MLRKVNSSVRGFRRATAAVIFAVLCFCALRSGFCETSRISREGEGLSFPKDDGSHKDFLTEWWYYTIHVYKDGDVPFVNTPIGALQLTFFRRKLSDKKSSEFQQGYLAHAAYTDLEGNRFDFEEKRVSGGVGVAGAATGLLRVWHGDWTVEEAGNSQILRFEVGTSDNLRRFRLVMDMPEPWQQGIRGKSRKGSCEECYSYYYSRPRMSIRGSMELGGNSVPVTGIGWMDHEYMNHIMNSDDAGWDWMGLMFRDGSDLMVFQMRGSRGETRFTSGTLRRGGKSIPLDSSNLALVAEGDGVTAKSGATYPTSWHIRIKEYGIDLHVKARRAEQELLFDRDSPSPIYWEGPVTSTGEEVLGFLEMTGYAAALGKQL